MKIIFLDLETTGLNPQEHHVLDIAFKIYDCISKAIIDSYQSIVLITEEQWAARDPGSLDINGFTWDKTRTGKLLTKISTEIQDVLNRNEIKRGNAVFLCQNPSFDRAFFSRIVEVYEQERMLWPYHWLDLASMFWFKLQTEYKKEGKPFPEELSVSKNAIASYFGLSEEAMPHGALQGVEHLMACYWKVLGE